MSLTNLLSNFMVLIFGSYVALGVLESFTKLSLRLFCKANKVLNSWFVCYVSFTFTDNLGILESEHLLLTSL